MSQIVKKYLSLIWLAILLLVGMLCSSAITFYSTHYFFPQSVSEHSLPLSADAIHAEIQRNIARAVQLSSFKAEENFIREWTANSDLDPAAMLAHLKSEQQKDHAITHFFVSESDHQLFDSQGSIRLPDQDNIRDAWYFKTRNNTQAFEMLVLPELGVINRPLIFISYRVLDATGKLLGISGVSLPLDIYSATSERYVTQLKQAIYFVDSSAKIILSNNKHNKHGNIHEQDGIKTIADDILANDQTTITKLVTAEQFNAVIHTRYVPELGWYMILEETPLNDLPAAQWVH